MRMVHFFIRTVETFTIIAKASPAVAIKAAATVGAGESNLSSGHLVHFADWVEGDLPADWYC